jgi:hypothetical protein
MFAKFEHPSALHKVQKIYFHFINGKANAVDRYTDGGHNSEQSQL